MLAAAFVMSIAVLFQDTKEGFSKAECAKRAKTQCAGKRKKERKECIDAARKSCTHSSTSGTSTATSSNSCAKKKCKNKRGTKLATCIKDKCTQSVNKNNKSGTDTTSTIPATTPENAEEYDKCIKAMPDTKWMCDAIGSSRYKGRGHTMGPGQNQGDGAWGRANKWKGWKGISTAAAIPPSVSDTSTNSTQNSCVLPDDYEYTGYVNMKCPDGYNTSRCTSGSGPIPADKACARKKSYCNMNTNYDYAGFGSNGGCPDGYTVSKGSAECVIPSDKMCYKKQTCDYPPGMTYKPRVNGSCPTGFTDSGCTDANNVATSGQVGTKVDPMKYCYSNADIF